MILEKISEKTGIDINQVKIVIELSEQDNTVHFIARYRKEKTGNLDENQIRTIIESYESRLKLQNRKEEICVKIEEAGKLTDKIKSFIDKAETLTELDDIYAPFKKSVKTKADKAKEKGFGPVAASIYRDGEPVVPSNLLDSFTKEEVIEGASDIVTQEIADDPYYRDFFYNQYMRFGIFITKLVKTEDEKLKEKQLHYKNYFDFSVSIYRIKDYQLLALSRAEKEGVLKFNLEKDDQVKEKFINKICRRNSSDILISCSKNAYTKIYDSVNRRIKSELSEIAKEKAIEVFQKNLKQLLMLKPHYNESILAIDPGYKTGCKFCIIEKNTKPLSFGVFYLFEKINLLRF